MQKTKSKWVQALKHLKNKQVIIVNYFDDVFTLYDKKSIIARMRILT